MKTFFLSIALLLVTSLGLFAQSGLSIQSSGIVTVNGNTYIVPSTFICGKPFIDSRDNQVYITIQIGSQCWMAQNLNVGTKILGSAEQTNNGILEKYCYSNDDANCAIYGGLYQWDEAMQYSITEGVRGICPLGWHLPTDAEWSSLTTFLGGYFVAGGKLKEAGTAHWLSPNTGAINSSGFSALPGGFRVDNDENFFSITYLTYIWSSSQAVATSAWNRYLSFFSESVGRFDNSNTYGFSIRCLKD